MRRIYLSLLGILFVIPLLSQSQIDAYRYWLDQAQPGNPVSISPVGMASISTQIPTQSLDPGFHVLHFQAKDNVGRWSSVESQPFYKINQDSLVHLSQVEYWFDEDVQQAIQLPVSATDSLSELSLSLDVETLSPGFHWIHIRFKQATNSWSGVISRPFYKLISGANPILSYEYWFDDHFNNRISQTFQINSGLIFIDHLLSTDVLAAGRHDVHIRFQQATGEWSAVESHMFYHPGTGNQIAGYAYWFSGQSPVIVNFASPQAQMTILERLFVQNPNNMADTLFIRFRDIRGNWSAVFSQTFQNNGTYIPGLTGVVYDVELDLQIGELLRGPLEGATVYLIQGQQVVDSTISAVNGTFDFSSVFTGDYSIQVKKEQGGTVYQSTLSNLNYGAPNEFSLPISLTNLISDGIPMLEVLDVSIPEFGEQSQMWGYDLEVLKDILIDAASTEDEAKQVIETLGRLYLLEESLSGFYGNANALVVERQLAIKDISIAFSSFLNVFKLILGKAPNSSQARRLLVHKNGLINRAIRTLTDFALGLISGEGQETKTEIKAFIDNLTLVTEGSFVEAVIRAAADEHIVRRPLYRQLAEKYRDPTQGSVDLSLMEASSFPVQGAFKQAFEDNKADLSEASVQVNDLLSKAKSARDLADVAGKINNIVSISQNLSALNFALSTAFLPWIKKLKLLLKGMQLGVLAGSVAFSQTGVVYNRASAMQNQESVLLRMEREGPMGIYLSEDLMSYSLEADSSLDSWIDNLRDISQAIANGQPQQAEQLIDLQIHLDEQLNQHMDSLIFPISAANEMLGDSIPNFQEKFSNALGEPVWQFEWDRLLTFQILLEYALDSVKAPYADSLNVLASQIEQQWLDLQPSLDSAFQQIAFVPSPAYIQPTQVDIPDTLQPGASYPCKIVFSNVGKIQANNLVVILKAENGLSSSIETAMIQNMTPGSTDSLSFMIQAPNTDTIGTYQILFLSGNTASGGIGGAIRVGNPVFTSIEAQPLWSRSKVYPNPFESITHLEFELSAAGEVVHSVYALSGQLMHWEKRMMPGPGQQQLIFDGSRLPTGMYLSRIQTRDKIFLARILKK